MKAALFLAIAMIFYRTGGSSIRYITGLGQQMPWTMAAFVVAGCGGRFEPDRSAIDSGLYLQVVSDSGQY